MLVPLVLLLTASMSLAAPLQRSCSKLNQTQLTTHLANGKDILGDIEDSRCGNLSDWMKEISCKTDVRDLSIPGTHDSSTWNYSTQTVSRIYKATNENDTRSHELVSQIYRCQSRSLFQMMGDGIRMFDLRIGRGPAGNDSSPLRIYHAKQLLSIGTTLEDVFMGFYAFLDEHPSEMLVVSTKVDNGVNNEALQTQIHTYQTTGAGKDFWFQANATIPTLGDARGKILALNRVGNAKLPASLTPVGLDLGPSVFADNDPDFQIKYKAPDTSSVVRVEDYYEPGGPSGPESRITWKTNATIAHLAQAASAPRSQDLWMTFASAFKNDEGVFPQIMALGNATTYGAAPAVSGVNQRLLADLKAQPDARKGIVLLDWYHQVPGLVEAVIGCNEK